MQGVTLESVRDEDSAVFIHVTLTFHRHVTAVVNKASKILGLVRKTFACLDETTVPRLLVRTHLEYMLYGQLIQEWLLWM